MRRLLGLKVTRVRWSDNGARGRWSVAMKYEIPQMLKQGGGSIVNTASAAGLIGLPGGTAYVASKHGVAGLTKSAALEYAKSGIRINAVCPGFIRTAMVERVIDGGSISEEAMIASRRSGESGSPKRSPMSCCFCALMTPRS